MVVCLRRLTKIKRGGRVECCILLCLTNEGVGSVAVLVIPIAGLLEVDDGAVLVAAPVVWLALGPESLSRKDAVGPRECTLMTLDGVRRNQDHLLPL